VSCALDDDGGAFAYSYFEEADGVMFETVTTYTDGPALTDGQRSIEWNHGMGEIVNALIGAGLVIDALEEHDWTRFPRFPWLVPDGDGRWCVPVGRPRIPLAFTLEAHRGAPP
jgi:hypothetical protein